MPDPGRHTVRLDDAAVALIIRALKAYSLVMTIQGPQDTRRESDYNAHISAVVQSHLNCDCGGMPGAGPAGHKLIPIADRKLV